MRKRAHAWGSFLLTAALTSSFLGGGTALALAGADEVADGGLPFVAKVSFGDIHSCSGALVAPQWIITAKECFANGDTPVAAGPPARPATVVVGRTDVSTTAGRRLSVTTLVPHPDRNVVLAQLSGAASGIVPVPVGRTAPAEGDTLRIAGYGRTATEWVPDRLHAGAFTVQSATATTLEVVGASAGAILCRGDSGGPALRETPGGFELVGISDSSWQKGCIGEPDTESRGQGYETRVDDLAGWIAAGTSVRPAGLRQVVLGEFTRDGFQDVIGIDALGWGWWYRSTSATTFGNPVRLSSTWGAYKELVVGRIDRDAYDDLLVLTDSGQLLLYTGTAAGGLTGRGQISAAYAGYRDLAVGKLNGDTYDALYAIESATGAWFKWAQTSAGGAFSTTRQSVGGGWGCCQKNVFGKFNADAHLDLLTIESATGKIRIYPGTASGALGTGAAVDSAGTSWGNATDVAAGAFDNTGLAGLLTIDSAGTLSVHRRTTDGGWVDRAQLAGTAWQRQPYDMARLVGGEFNGNSHPDLIGIDAEGWGWLFPGTAAGAWGSPVRLSSTWGTYKELVVGRIDRDAIDDLLILTDSGQLLLYTGTATGSLNPKGQISAAYAGYRDLTVGRLDGDTYDALYAIETSTGAWFKWPQTTAGGAFATTRTQVGGGWTCCKQNVFGKFNDDSHLDLVTVETSGRIRLYPGTESGALGTATTVDSAGTAFANRDLAATRSPTTGRDSLLARDPSGTVLVYPSTQFAPGTEWNDPIIFGPRG
ncbi:S1 family peptidase [Paractinoplanes hotanensis]|uniref:Trypsin-like serine protease n=1 Tax=Paractinoplanes hotanensis TaxID=2906497 RepID=A0ABT0XZM0_9ACTN|nr:trypsin-like serine protease [Actinoplanes hotanensis]MCM4079237.1 trypsin-like serine protease [Actinoplanes hotanensis]